MIMNLIEPFVLKHTNVSQPRLSNQNSKRSLAASEDFYSLSESSSGDAESKKTARRYSTPPSRIRSPEDKDALLGNAQSLGELARSQTSLTIPPSVRFEPQSYQVKRKPVPSGGSFDEKKMDPHGSPITTPGVDDTPYIRFAIDQLTRDEEIRGTRQFPPPGSALSTNAKEKDISGLPFAGDPDDNRPAQRASLIRRPTPDEYQVQTGVYDAGLGYMEQQKAASAGIGFPAPATVPARRPANTTSPTSPASRQANVVPPPAPPPPASDSPDVFVPYRASFNSPAHPQLRFLPGILRPLWLGTYIALVVLMLTGLMFCAIYSDSSDGLWAYAKWADGRYFVFEYLPTMFGMVLLLWLFEIEGAVTRIAPFIALSSGSTRARSNAVFLDLQPIQFLYPRFEYFRSAQPLIGACFLAFWLFLFTIPLLGSSFNAQYFGPAGQGQWRYVAVQGVIWTCIALYIILILALGTLAFYLWRVSTGLKWDPRSLADYIALLERSNIMADYSGTETFSRTSEFRQRLWNRTDRLGYWSTTRRAEDVFYGIGEEGGSTRVYSIEGGRIKEKVPAQSRDGVRTPADNVDLESGAHSYQNGNGVFSIRADIRSFSVRRRHLPWFLLDGPLVAWIVIAVALYIAFLVVSFVNDALNNGFSPSLDASSNGSGFSSANFLYSFIPTLIGLLLFLLWQPIDLAYRRLEPYAELSSPTGATAAHSLLLDYPSCLPVSVTLKALLNRHWTVAYISFASFVSVSLPVLASGMFWTQYYPRDASVRIAASPPALYALCFFLGVYVASFAAACRGRTRRRALPHAARNLAQHVSWVYMSRLVGDRAFARCETKAELVARLVSAGPAHPSPPMRAPGFLGSVTSLLSRGGGGAAARSRQDLPATAAAAAAAPAPAPTVPARGEVKRVAVPGEARYGFGVYVGRDGQEHLGIDKVRRDGGSEMVLFDDYDRRGGGGGGGGGGSAFD